MSKVGCPIRKSTDQRLFAPSRSLSQRTTSFIASYRQGIHQMPLSHLIALISNAHPVLAGPAHPRRMRVPGRHSAWMIITYRKTRSQNKPAVHGHLRSHEPSPLLPGLRLVAALERTGFWPALGRVPSLRCQDHRLRRSRGGIRCSSITDETGWWSQTGSNRRPHACKARALPAELWPQSRQRRHIQPSPNSQPSQTEKTWWAWEDLNFRPHAYQARALTN